MLADKYKALVGDGKAFEVVFVSSDKDEASFDEYYAEQPWLALPFGSRDVKAALSKKYKVSGIPSLVLLDGDGAIITKDGRRPPLVPTHRRYNVHHRPAPPRRRSAVMEGDFPFTPPTFWDCLGDEFLMQDGDAAEVSQLKGEGKVIVLYFSAHWYDSPRPPPPPHASVRNRVYTTPALAGVRRAAALRPSSSRRWASSRRRARRSRSSLSAPTATRRASKSTLAAWGPTFWPSRKATRARPSCRPSSASRARESHVLTRCQPRRLTCGCAVNRHPDASDSRRRDRHDHPRQRDGRWTSLEPSRSRPIGATINGNARGACGGDPDGLAFPWAPKPVVDFADGCDGINDTLSLCLLLEGCGLEVQQAAIAAATPLAEAAKASQEELCFFAATKVEGGPVSQIRQMTKLGDAGSAPAMILLDIPDEGGGGGPVWFAPRCIFTPPDVNRCVLRERRDRGDGHDDPSLPRRLQGGHARSQAAGPVKTSRVRTRRARGKISTLCCFLYEKRKR